MGVCYAYETMHVKDTSNNYCAVTITDDKLTLGWFLAGWSDDGTLFNILKWVVLY